MNFRTLLKRALVLAAATVFTASAFADLARVGPIDPANGFPLWYQDKNGLVLDKCFPTSNLAGGDPGGAQQNACLLTFPPPYTFPTNFPDEFFYLRAVTAPFTVGTAATAPKAVIVLALEGAFANGAPAVGDQMVFTRIRVTTGVPVDGTYTVYHPYGEDQFFAVATGGNRDISFTEDVGLVAGVFTDALRSRVGPFLVEANSSGAPTGGRTINGALFLSDGATPVEIRGGPFAKKSNGNNYVMICGVDETGLPITLGTFGAGGPGTGNCAGTDLWTLTGKPHDNVANPIGTPLQIERATYARDGTNGTRVDVHANATRVLGSQNPPLLSAATAEVAPARMVGPDALNRYFAQGMAAPNGTKPSQAIVTNSADSPPTSVTAPVVDVVSILAASFDAANQILTVQADSSDKGFGLSPAPVLSLSGYPAATTSVGAQGTTFTVGGLTVAPASVTVQSQYGGMASADVASTSLGTYAAGSPLAVDDSQAYLCVGTACTATTVQADPTRPVKFLVLNNDVPGAGSALDPLTVTILAPGVTPALGTATANADGTVTFTPGSVGGTATFKYTVQAGGVAGASNPATVTVTLVQATAPTPTANPDGPIDVTVGTSTSPGINVLANDSANGGALDPTTVTTSNVAGGTTTVNADGSVTFSAGTTAGTFGFDYTVKNTVATGGRTSNVAHVTVNVTPVTEALTVALAECRRSKNRWRVNGSSNILTGHTISLLTSGTSPTLIGASVVDALGNWAIDVSGGPACQTTATLRSTIGPKDFPISVTNRN